MKRYRDAQCNGCAVKCGPAPASIKGMRHGARAGIAVADEVRASGLEDDRTHRFARLNQAVSVRRCRQRECLPCRSTRPHIHRCRRQRRCRLLSHHRFRRQPVQVGRSTRHDALVVHANVAPTDIISHDENDVGFFLRCLQRLACSHERNRGYQQG